MSTLSMTLQHQRDAKTVRLVLLEAINLSLEKIWAYALRPVRPSTVALECFKFDMWLTQTLLNSRLREMRIRHVYNMLRTERQSLDQNNPQHQARLREITVLMDRMEDEVDV
jgi:hypothetical protein